MTKNVFVTALSALSLVGSNLAIAIENAQETATLETRVDKFETWLRINQGSPDTIFSGTTQIFRAMIFSLAFSTLISVQI